MKIPLLCSYHLQKVCLFVQLNLGPIENSPIHLGRIHRLCSSRDSLPVHFFLTLNIHPAATHRTTSSSRNTRPLIPPNTSKNVTKILAKNDFKIYDYRSFKVGNTHIFQPTDSTVSQQDRARLSAKYTETIGWNWRVSKESSRLNIFEKCNSKISETFKLVNVS